MEIGPPREVALRVRVRVDAGHDAAELLERDATVLRRSKGRRDLPPRLWVLSILSGKSVLGAALSCHCALDNCINSFRDD